MTSFNAAYVVVVVIMLSIICKSLCYFWLTIDVFRISCSATSLHQRSYLKFRKVMSNFDLVDKEFNETRF